jgi:hypothetical protein
MRLAPDVAIAFRISHHFGYLAFSQQIERPSVA